MALHRINDFDPNYRSHFGDRDILKFDVYSNDEKVGSIDDVLIDQGGHLRYLVVHVGTWIFGKKVLIPIGRSQIDERARRVYIDQLTPEQVKRLPEYQGEPIDYDYEERVRGVYRPTVANQKTTTVPVPDDRTRYHYDQDPDLYTLNERDHGYWKRAEARLMAGKPIAGKQRRAIGVFPDRRSAEEALLDLRDAGFPMDRVSVVARDVDQQKHIAGASVRERVGNKADEGATIGAVSGGALGGITGLLVGLGALAIPGVGPILLAGATATALATTLAGGAIGALSGGLVGALIGLGIPEERARVYQDRIARGGYLVIVDGTDADITRAETILRRRGIEDYGVYDAPSRSATQISSTHSLSTHSPSTHSHDVAEIPKTVPTEHLDRSATTTPTPLPAQSSSVPADRRFAIGFFSHLSDAESAIDDLRRAGFPLSQISLIAHKLPRRERFSGLELRDRFEAARLGIPAEQARFYEDRIGRGEYLVIVHGTEDELNHATPILNHRGIQAWRIYRPTVVYYELPLEAPRIPKATVVNASSTLVTPDLGGSRIDRTKAERLPYAVGFFSHRRDAEQGIADLRNAGFPLEQISLVAQRLDQREPFKGIDLRDRFDNRRFGVPEDRVQFFNHRIAQGDDLVLIQGTTDQLRQAEAILTRPRVHEFGIYDAHNVEITHHSQESVQRHVAPDIDPAHPNRDPQVEPSQHMFIDRRNETYR